MIRLIHALLIPVWFAAAADAPKPLVQAHAHNDYEHARPLLDALDNGFCSVEADIHLVDGKLLVAHDASAVKPERTLQSLYLDPLLARVKQNGGRVYKDGPPVLLLIDVKGDAAKTYDVLRGVLKEYAAMLTEFRDGKIMTNAVTAIITGNRDLDLMKKESSRYAAYDGRLADLESKESPSPIPLVSESWGIRFKWRGQGDFPIAEKTLLRDLVRKAHSQGRILRFWAAPDSPAGWKELKDGGLDLINTDHLAELRKYLNSEPHR